MFILRPYRGIKTIVKLEQTKTATMEILRSSNQKYYFVLIRYYFIYYNQTNILDCTQISTNGKLKLSEILDENVIPKLLYWYLFFRLLIRKQVHEELLNHLRLMTETWFC